MSEQEDLERGGEQEPEGFFAEDSPLPDALPDAGRIDRRRIRRRVRQAWLLVLMALALGLVVLYWVADDVAYFFQSPVPVDLGLAEDLKNPDLQNDEYVRVRGIARDMCIRAGSSSSRVRFLYLLGSEIGSRIVIEEPVGEDDGCVGAVDRVFEGRLLDLSTTARYDSVLAHYRSRFPSAPREGPMYLLRDGQRPRESLWGPLVLLVVLVVWGLNARMLWRVRRFGKQADAEGGTR
jgi:hypothetical protein